MAALLLLLGGLAQLLRSAGPVTASSAFWFWLLSAPVRRRDLLRRRYLVLLAAAAVLACTVAGLVAHTGSVAVLPVVAAAGLAAAALGGGAVCGQAWELADHVGQAAGQAMRAAGVLAFGSLATGVGRAGLNSVLRAPPDAAVIVLAVLAVTAVACCALGYRALDRIDVSVLRRGQGLWTAGHVAAASMDVFMLTEFLADRRARQAGRVRPGADGGRVRHRARAVGVGAAAPPPQPRRPRRGCGGRLVGLPAGAARSRPRCGRGGHRLLPGPAGGGDAAAAGG